MKKFIAILLFNVLLTAVADAKEEIAWDNTAKRSWLPEFEQVEIKSSVDGAQQKAYIYKSKSREPMPLIVSLHTWSGYYNQTDPLTKEILARDWNYIHPDFRGANRRPEAMGSPLALADIEDAIRYALENMNVDKDEVHVIGVSGGGFATLAAFMNLNYPVKSFSAWASISDIEDWYWECTGRGSHYAKDILAAVDDGNHKFNTSTARQRSPLRQKFPIDKRKKAQLYIYAGIHDGYKGSVPISHSLKMYNRLVGELKYGTANMAAIMQKALSDPGLVSPSEMLDLLGRRMHPAAKSNSKIFDREVHLKRGYKNIHLTVFEGVHEQLPQALGLLPYKPKESDSGCRILAIGDSNGHKKGGWVDQLKFLMPAAKIVNQSESGRTIGFDNKGKSELNALKNIDRYLDNALTENRTYDYVIVCLGTNDAKKMFESRQEEVPGNLKALLSKIKSHKLVRKGKTGLIFVTPPPLRQTDVSPKYDGSGTRLAELIPKLKAVAAEGGFDVIDIHGPLSGVLDYYAKDGVHMSPQGQQIVASKILLHLISK